MLYCNLLLQNFDARITLNIGHALVNGKLYGVEYSQCTCAVLVTVSVSIIIICPLHTAAIFSSIAFYVLYQWIVFYVHGTSLASDNLSCGWCIGT